MKKKKQNKLKFFNKFLPYFIALLIFIVPALLTVDWLDSAVKSETDSKLVKVEDFKTRPADTTGEDIKPFEEGIVTITFDDGWESSYNVGYPIMQRYGIHATHYLIAGEFDNPTYISVDQTKDLMAHGHEIASHTMTHPDLVTLTPDKLTYELSDSKNILNSKFNNSIKDFASPMGSSDNPVKDEIQKYYRSSRNTRADPKDLEDVDVNIRKTFDRYDINAYTVRLSTTVEDLKAYIDYARQNKAWVVLTYHQIDNGGEEYSVTPEAFEAQMKMLFDMKIKSAPLGRVLDKIGE